MNLYSKENSNCKQDLLHDYQIVKSYSDAVVERCTRCHKQVYFRNNVNNAVYLSHHIRSMLQTRDPRFNREYNNNNV